MKEFKGKTAVITGASHGFGAEFAKEAARRGMNLVLADIDGDALAATEKDVKDLGAKVFTLTVDVSLYEGVQEVVASALANFGGVDLMINNAGVYFIGSVVDMPVRDFQWMFDANVMSVIYGMKEAIPVMQKQGAPCHILNVASIAGIITNRTMTAYHASKHAVVAASEATYYDLQATEGNQIGMSIFCPGYVQTDLNNCEKHRPARYRDDNDPYYKSDTYKKNVHLVDKFITGGEPIDDVAAICFKAIEDDQFYILPTEMFEPWTVKRHRNIEQKKNPDINNMF